MDLDLDHHLWTALIQRVLQFGHDLQLEHKLPESFVHLYDQGPVEIR